MVACGRMLVWVGALGILHGHREPQVWTENRELDPGNVRGFNALCRGWVWNGWRFHAQASAI